MMPNQLKDLSGSALSSLFFLSNFWFFLTDNYLLTQVHLNLYCILESSIEEQFYILFPPILYFLYRKKFKGLKYIFYFLDRYYFQVLKFLF